VAIDLNDKPWYVALIVGVILGVVILFLMNMYFYKPQKADIADLEQKIYKLEREIEKGRQAKADLPRLEEDIRNYELELDRLTRILPTRRETPALIKRLKQISELGYFRLLRFQPAAFIDRDYYLEWPIKVELDGTYHELGLFFDRLSRFSRIINVGELKITPARRGGTSYTIHATFTQRTFIYKETKGQ
jgi:type IV pilus assembly protein PilO